MARNNHPPFSPHPSTRSFIRAVAIHPAALRHARRTVHSAASLGGHYEDANVELARREVSPHRQRERRRSSHERWVMNTCLCRVQLLPLNYPEPKL